MGSPAVVDQTRVEGTTPRWSLATRLAFRLCVVYFAIYCLSTQIITTLIAIPNLDLPDPSSIPPLRPIIGFAAAHIFHLAVTPAFFAETGSGDRPCDWVLVFCLLVFSLLGTALWSILDRRRNSYPPLCKWLWLLFRICLAGQLFAYAFVKIVPLQMPFPLLFKLVEPFGSFSPMGVLWSSIGASPAYEIFAGCAECLGGILLLIPRTRTLGALVCLADMVQVFLLNMTYDVPVKLLSFHLILLSLVLLAPEFRRLANFFFLNRPTDPRPPNPLFRTRRANRTATALQILFISWLLGTNIYGARQGWKQFGGGATKPVLYGIWDVEQQTIDGQPHPPLLTDTARWRRVLFDVNNLAVVEGMDDQRTFYSVAIDTHTNTLKLTDRVSAKAMPLLTYTRPTDGHLIVDGPLNGHKIHLELRLYDRNKFLVVGRGFHWVQQSPYNR